jgi:hypothetical protein
VKCRLPLQVNGGAQHNEDSARADIDGGAMEQTLSFDAFNKFIEDDFLGGQRLDPRTDGRPDPRVLTFARTRRSSAT